MKTLLIFDRFGEAQLALYLVPDAPEWLARCHESYLGGDGDDDVQDLVARAYDAICENPDYYCAPDDEICGKWVKHKIKVEETARIGDVRIVITGAVP